jgi:acyl dehydratase
MGMMYVADFNVGDGWTSGEYTVDQEEMLVYNRTNDRWPIRVDQAAIKSRFWWIERHWCTGRPMK